MNTITFGDDLIYLDYSDLLDKILQAINSHDIFKINNNGSQLFIDIDTIATYVASLRIENPLGTAGHSVKSATVNLSPGSQERFHQLVSKIKYYIKQQLESRLHDTSLEQFISSLTTEIKNLQGKESLNFTYPFQPYEGLQKQRLTFNKNDNGRQILKFHRLSITVQKIGDFTRQLEQGLERYIDFSFSDVTVTEREDLGYILEDLEKDKNSDFYRLQRIVDTETLGKLKKQAQINYLEFLLENVNNSEGGIYLQDLIRRLKLVEGYIGKEKPDGDYLVSYGGVLVNYREMFSRGEAFEILPIIPKIEGYLGENKDEVRSEIEFVFGVKLKLNGKVQAFGGKNVFEYHMNLLNPDSQEHKEGLANELMREGFVRKVLKIAFLYYFVFASRQRAGEEGYDIRKELEYDPVKAFDEHVISKLSGNDEPAKVKLFCDIYKHLQKIQVQIKINSLKKLLVDLLKRQSHFPTREYPLHISVRNGILEDNTENIFKNNTFFRPVLKDTPKKNLHYISLGEAQVTEKSLCSLPAKITISDIHFFGTDDRQTFSMEYDIRGIRALPILFLPWSDGSCKKLYQQTFAHRKLILFPYSTDTNKLESHQAFIYKYTYSLLAYTCLYVLLEQQQRLFIPMLRLHLKNKQDDAPLEKFMVSLTNVLSHLLNETHRANSQGIDIRDLQGKGKFKIPNVMSSLYSILPKKFTFTNTTYSPQLDKLAIVVVSSRESDRRWGSTQKISNLIGEIIGLRLEKNSVRVQLLTTFSDNYTKEQLFTHPSTVIEHVAKLYNHGYRHFVYIAKAPYTSTLHMTQTEEDDGLFFMSKDVIDALTAQHQDIKIYPMFFDKYYAVSPTKVKASSLYIQDTVELTNLVKDTSKKSVVFFNLFNGVHVPGEEKHYNGVMSYSTLLNIYNGILDDEDIRTGLMYDGALKNDILQYLTLFHFSRYQKAAKEIHLKLDPYDNLIGDDSVGKLAIFNHMRGKAEFNSLAFLTLVRKVFNVA